MASWFQVGQLLWGRAHTCAVPTPKPEGPAVRPVMGRHSEGFVALSRAGWGGRWSLRCPCHPSLWAWLVSCPSLSFPRWKMGIATSLPAAPGRKCEWGVRLADPRLRALVPRELAWPASLASCCFSSAEIVGACLRTGIEAVDVNRMTRSLPSRSLYK